MKKTRNVFLHSQDHGPSQPTSCYNPSLQCHICWRTNFSEASFVLFSTLSWNCSGYLRMQCTNCSSTSHTLSCWKFARSTKPHRFCLWLDCTKLSGWILPLAFCAWVPSAIRIESCGVWLRCANTGTFHQSSRICELFGTRNSKLRTRVGCIATSCNKTCTNPTIVNSKNSYCTANTKPI